MEPATVNVLFLGGAKRVSMGRAMIEAGRRLGLDCRIFSYELSEREPIACIGTVIRGLRWADPALHSHLLEVCRENDIRAVVPFVDGAVAPAARLAAEGIFVPAAAPALCTRAFDKVAAQVWFESLCLPVPAALRDAAELDSRPYIAKPRFGSASKGICVLRSRAEFDAFTTRRDEYLIQEYIADREEYTVDCYVHTASGEILAAVPRCRLEVSGGEVTRTVTFTSPAVEDLARDTLRRTGLRGAVTVQMLRDNASGRLMLMEINPRLGGGAVCSVAAGAPLPEYILREALALPCTPAQWLPEVEIARYPQEVVFLPK